MKRFSAVFFGIVLFVCLLFGCSCSGDSPARQSVFAFLSVRLKGNGDGTLTAVAQNEFSIGWASLPVSLTLYRSQEYQSEVDNMLAVASVDGDDLTIFERLEVRYAIESEGYFCARVVYRLNGEVRYIQSDTLRYGADGNRM